MPLNQEQDSDLRRLLHMSLPRGFPGLSELQFITSLKKALIASSPCTPSPSFVFLGCTLWVADKQEKALQTFSHS